MLSTVVNVKDGNSGNSSCPSQGLKSYLGKFIDLGTVLLIEGEPQGTGKWQTRDSSRAASLIELCCWKTTWDAANTDIERWTAHFPLDSTKCFIASCVIFVLYHRNKKNNCNLTTEAFLGWRILIPQGL